MERAGRRRWAQMLRKNQESLVRSSLSPTRTPRGAGVDARSTIATSCGAPWGRRHAARSLRRGACAAGIRGGGDDAETHHRRVRAGRGGLPLATCSRARRAGTGTYISPRRRLGRVRSEIRGMLASDASRAVETGGVSIHGKRVPATTRWAPLRGDVRCCGHAMAWARASRKCGATGNGQLPQWSLRRWCGEALLAS